MVWGLVRRLAVVEREFGGEERERCRGVRKIYIPQQQFCNNKKRSFRAYLGGRSPTRLGRGRLGCRTGINWTGGGRIRWMFSSLREKTKRWERDNSH